MAFRDPVTELTIPEGAGPGDDRTVINADGITTYYGGEIIFHTGPDNTIFSGDIQLPGANDALLEIMELPDPYDVLRLLLKWSNTAVPNEQATIAGQEDGITLLVGDTATTDWASIVIDKALGFLGRIFVSANEVEIRGEKQNTTDQGTLLLYAVNAITISAASTNIAAGSFKGPRGTTAQRPTAASVGDGAQYYDTTTNMPIWSDGAAWRNALGVVV